MANLVQLEANALLAASSGGTLYTNPVSPIKVALVVATGSATAAGTEVLGGSYARQTLTMDLPTAGTISSSAALTYTNMPAVTVTGVDEYDSSGSPVRRWFGALSTPKTTNAGDTLTIASGSYTKTLS